MHEKFGQSAGLFLNLIHMSFALLLQVSTPQPTPYAVYATLAVGVLSLIASGLNIYFSSKTAQKVVTLSTKTTREVAELSAQVTRESAGLAAQTAREIKEQDYKYDFHKKIIEKRLLAWSNSESLMSMLGTYVMDESDKKLMHNYFISWKLYNQAVAKLAKHDMESVWISRKYSETMTAYLNVLYDIKVKFDGGQDESADYDSDEALSYLYEKGKHHHVELNLMWKKSMRLLGSEISKLHDLTILFRELSELGASDD